jgi:chromosome segregation ATPase
LGNSNVLITTTEQQALKKINEGQIPISESEHDKVLKELQIFKNTKTMVCATANIDKPTASNTSCIRFFNDINNVIDYIDIPSHHGETYKVRINYDENYIFTTGADGCVCIYSLDDSWGVGDDNDKLQYFKIPERFTETVLIKRTKLKEKESEKIELPEKREEQLKKIRVEGIEAKDRLQKQIESNKTQLAIILEKHSRQATQKRNELETLVANYSDELTKLIAAHKQEYKKQLTDNQIELAALSKEIEKVRESIRNSKTSHKENLLELKSNFETNKVSKEQFYLEKLEKLEKAKDEYEGNLKKLEKNKDLDAEANKWLNDQILKKIEESIDVLKAGIDDLQVHNNHQIKKLYEDIERQNALIKKLTKELTQMSEEEVTLLKRKFENEKLKAFEEEAVKDVTKRISEVEKKIIFGKRKNQYLEKCKFVLDYKIKELKREMGPIDKAIEDLKIRTSKLDRDLENYTKELEIINKKNVDLGPLDDKIDQLKTLRTNSNNEIKYFQNEIFKMVSDIDNVEKIRVGMRNLQKKFLEEKKYKHEVYDVDLEAEFNNQKDNMENNVKDLAKQLKEIKKIHKVQIERNREHNSKLIDKINHKRIDILDITENNKREITDRRHNNAVATNIAKRKMDRIEELEFESPQDKVDYLEALLQEKRHKLQKLKSSLVLPNLNRSHDYDA